MRYRAAAIVFALVALAFGGRPSVVSASVDEAATGRLSVVCAAQPAGDTEPPALLANALQSSADIQTAPLDGGRRSIRPVLGTTDGPVLPPAGPVRSARPLTFPLLI